MIIRSRMVAPVVGEPIENAAVAISGNQIAGVGRWTEIKASHGGEIIDLGEMILMPGLINAHCHLDYTCLRGKIPSQKSFTDWIKAINAEKSELSAKDYLASINDGFKEAKRFGTTTIANLTAFPQLISQVQPTIRTCWFAELIDIRAPEHTNELVNSAIESLRRARSKLVLSETEGGGPWGLAPEAASSGAREARGVRASGGGVRRGEPASGRGKVMRGGRPSSPPAWRAAAALKRGGAPRPQRKVPTSLRRTATSGLRGRRRRGGRPRGEVAERDGDGGRSREMGRARRGGEVREGRADSGGRRRREGRPRD